MDYKNHIGDIADSPVDEKVRKYEVFLNDKLKNDLRKVHEQRDNIYQEISEYLQLQRTLESMKEYSKNCTNTNKQNTIKTMMDIGQNFYCQAMVEDCSRVCLLVGYGYYVDFERDEALKFIEKKVKRLTSKADALAKDSATIKANMRLVMEGLRELQQLQLPNGTRRRDVF